jgi:hypothetical protein
MFIKIRRLNNSGSYFVAFVVRIWGLGIREHLTSSA